MKIIKRIIIITWILIILSISILVGITLHHKNKEVYYAENFGITLIKSKKDYNNNGIDDYTDILLGAKEEAKKHRNIKMLIMQEVIHQKMKEYVQMLFGEHLKMQDIT